jgi:hypothetical protein
MSTREENVAAVDTERQRPNPDRRRRIRKFAVAAGVAAASMAAAASLVTVATTGEASATDGVESGTLTDTTPRAVYEAKLVNQHIVLGPQSAPTTLVTSPTVPAGTYQVSAIVDAVISPQDQIVCAANPPGQNDGVFGTAGNGATGTTDGIYGTAPITDTVTVVEGQRIALTCNAFNYGKGTYVGAAVLELRPANLHK